MKENEMKENETAPKPKRRELVATIEKLTKEAEQSRNTADMYRKSSQQLQTELDGLHDVIDGIDGALSRDKKDGYGKNPISARLLSAFIVMCKP